MMERRQLAAPDAAIAVSTLAVTSIYQTFGNGTPLHGEIVVVVIRSHLVNTPRKGAMVEDDARLVALPCGISTLVDILFLSTTETNETNDIISTRTDCIVTNRNAWRWSRLSENSNIVFDSKITSQCDDACHIEHHDAVSLAHSIAERTRTAILQVCDVVNCTLATTSDVATVSLCTRECRGVRLGPRHHCCQRCDQR